MVSKWTELKNLFCFLWSQRSKLVPYFCFPSAAYPSPLLLDQEELASWCLRAFVFCSHLKPSEAFIGRAVRGFTDRYQKSNSWASLLVVLSPRRFLRVVGTFAMRCLDSSSFAGDLGLSALPSRPPGSLVYEDRGAESRLDDGYPINLATDGIMVDDSRHPRDIVAMLRGGMEVLWR